MIGFRSSFRTAFRLFFALLAPGVAFLACNVEDEDGYTFSDGRGGAIGTDSGEGLSGAADGGSEGNGISPGTGGRTGNEGGTKTSGGSKASSSTETSGGVTTSNGGETGFGDAAGAGGSSDPGSGNVPGDGGAAGGSDPGEGGGSGNEQQGECMPSQTRPCSEGGFLGTCAMGSQLCTDEGTWGACNIEPAEADSCEEGNDDNCNGTINEGCPCVGNETRSCAEAGAMGRCAEGVQECVDGAWGNCSIEPAAADGCDPGNDDNCNGVPNEGCECVQGEMRSCADGGLLGACASGTQTCGANGKWGPCSITPAAKDTCEPDNDDNCNGTPNEGCPCVGDETRSCAEAGALGACAKGIQQCENGKWGACSITPAAKDTCASGNDANCNGIPNEGCGCIQGQTRPCSQGGLFGKCAAGTQTCTAQGTWGACSIAPSAEDTCVEGNDDNCNGTPNQGCLCINNVTTRSCGDCDDGKQVCTNGKTGQYGACTGATGVRTTYYRDADGDGWGSSATTTSCSKTPPSGYVDRTGDCCDSDKNAYPGQSTYFEAKNACGSWDYDCSGGVTTSPVSRGNGCRAGTTYPTCETVTQYYDETYCGTTNAHCACAETGIQTCTVGCGGAYKIKCK